MPHPKYLLLILPFLVACTRPIPPLSIGYINSPQLMQHYHGTLAQRRHIEAQARVWQRSLDSLTTGVATSSPSASPSSIAQSPPVARYHQQLQQKMQAASQQADQALIREVNSYLKKYGAEHHYDLIFGANDTGNIVYGTPTRDLTTAVLTGLNQEYDKQHPATE